MPLENDQNVRIPIMTVMMMKALITANPPEVNENVTVRISRTIRVTPVQNRYLSL